VHWTRLLGFVFALVLAFGLRFRPRKSSNNLNSAIFGISLSRIRIHLRRWLTFGRFGFTLGINLDAAGVDMLLRCMAEVMRRDGELKLAKLSPQAAVILELTRTDRLFEIFETSSDAVKSFQRFLPGAMKNLPVASPILIKRAGEEYYPASDKSAA